MHPHVLPMPLLVHNSVLGLSLGFGGRIFLKSLYKTLIIVYSLRVPTELLAPRLQKEPGKASVRLACCSPSMVCVYLAVYGLFCYGASALGQSRDSSPSHQTEICPKVGLACGGVTTDFSPGHDEVSIGC